MLTSKLEHIFLGEISNGKIKGYHHDERSYHDAKVCAKDKLYSKSTRRLITENKDKHLYEAVVVQKGTGIIKQKNGGKSTFFNENWNRQDVVDCIERSQKCGSVIKKYGRMSGSKQKKKMKTLYFDNKEGIVIVNCEETAYPILKY